MKRKFNLHLLRGGREETISLKILLYSIIVITAVSMIFPFLWMISTSLKTEKQIFTYPPVWIPQPIKWGNYVKMWKVAPFFRYILNSIIISSVGTLVTLFLSSLAGLAFSKYNFPGRNLIFVILLSTLMIPSQVTLIPVFLIVKNLHWLNSYQGLIIPGLANVFAIFLMRQFMITLPTELMDAARIDGCSEFSIYLQIVLPLSKSILVVLGILTYMSYWNDLFWPLIIINIDKMKTLQLGLALLKTAWVVEWNIVMAGTTLASVPIIIVFLFGQKYFIEGITLTGLKR